MDRTGNEASHLFIIEMYNSYIMHFITIKGQFASGICSLRQLWYTFLVHVLYLLPKTFKLFRFSIFLRLDLTWWRLFQERVVHT